MLLFSDFILPILALQQMGYRFSPTFVQNLLSKYDPRTKKLTLDNFIVASVQIKRLTGKLASHISNIIIICVLMTSGVKGANEIIGFKVRIFIQERSNFHIHFLPCHPNCFLYFWDKYNAHKENGSVLTSQWPRRFSQHWAATM